MTNRSIFTIAVAAGLAGAVLAASAAHAQERFAVERHGDAQGRAVVMLPGLASSGAVWDGSVAAIGTGYDIHVVTLAGFAGHPAPDTVEPFMESAVDALAAYLDAEGLENAVIVGHSLGGQIALQLAAARPDRTGGVLVVDSVPFLARLYNPAITPEEAAAFATLTRGQLANAPRETFLAMFRQGLPVQSLDEDYRETIYEWGAASDQQTVAAAMAELTANDYSAILPRVSAPVLVLAAWADGSPMPAEQVRAVYAAQYEFLPSGEVRVIEGARHFIMQDRSEAFHAELVRFIEETN